MDFILGGVSQRSLVGLWSFCIASFRILVILSFVQLVQLVQLALQVRLDLVVQ